MSSPTPHPLDILVPRVFALSKHLVESLAQWSRGRLTEQDISDIFVKLGNEFSLTCQAFSREGIAMGDLLSVPSELRTCLETCLSQERSEETLRTHLPTLRKIVIRLISGLKDRQAFWKANTRRPAQQRSTSLRKLSSDYDARVSPAQASHPASLSSSDPRLPPTSSPMSQSPSNPLPPATSSLAMSPAASQTQAQAQSHPYTQSQPLPSPQASSQTQLPLAENDKRSLPQRTLSASRGPSGLGGSLRTTPSFGRSPSQSTAASPLSPNFAPNLPPINSSPFLSGISPNSTHTDNSFDTARTDAVQTDTAQADATQRDTSQGDTTYLETVQAAPADTSHVNTSPNKSLHLDAPVEHFPLAHPSTMDPAGAQSLEMLKNADALARRASKRYSQYAFNKGVSFLPWSQRSTSTSFSQIEEENSFSSSTSHKRINSASSSAPSTAAAPVSSTPASAPAANSIPSSSLLENTVRASPVSPERNPKRTAGAKSPPSFDATQTPATLSPSRPALPPKSQNRSGAALQSVTASDSSTAAPQLKSPMAPAAKNYPFHVFLQVSNETVKVTLDEMPSESSLQALFIEKFAQVDSDLDNFPDIYHLDRESQVRYKLEEMSDIAPGSLISLHVDQLSRLTQHFDAGIEHLTGDVQFLKKQLASISDFVRDAPRTADTAPIHSSPVKTMDASTVPIITTEADSPLKGAASNENTHTSERDLIPAASGREPSESPLSAPQPQRQRSFAEPPPPVAVDNPTSRYQREQVVLLRRELGILKQFFADFAAASKQSFATVREQADAMRELASDAKIAESRQFIQAGLAKLETTASDLILRGDDLQDAVDQMRIDVSVKRTRPSQEDLVKIHSAFDALIAERQELIDWVHSVRPIFKATWAKETQTVVDEQGLLKTQLSWLDDLKDDLSQAQSVYEMIQQVSSSAPRAPRTAPWTPTDIPDDDAHSFSTVLLEIGQINPDNDKRVKAIEDSERRREKLLASKRDEFASELDNFVSNGKLKKSGGIQETERLRQAKSDAFLRQMFGGSAPPPPPPPEK